MMSDAESTFDFWWSPGQGCWGKSYQTPWNNPDAIYIPDTEIAIEYKDGKTLFWIVPLEFLFGVFPKILDKETAIMLAIAHESGRYAGYEAGGVAQKNGYWTSVLNTNKSVSEGTDGK